MSQSQDTVTPFDLILKRQRPLPVNARKEFQSQEGEKKEVSRGQNYGKQSRYGYVGCSKDFFSPGKTWLRRRACVCILFEKGFNKPRVWGRIKVFPPGQLFLSFSTGGARHWNVTGLDCATRVLVFREILCGKLRRVCECFSRVCTRW